MALYTKSSQQLLNNQPQSKKIVGIVLSVLSVLLIACLTISMPKFISNFVYGVLGLSSYAFLSFLSIIGVSLITNKKLIKNIKYFVFVLCACLCVLIFLHIILTAKAFEGASFSQYISYCYNFKSTVGGVVLGSISYLLYSMLKVVGACVVMAILLVIFIGLSVDSFLKNESSVNFKSKKIRDKIVLNEVENISRKRKTSTKTQVAIAETNSQKTVETYRNDVKIESSNSVLENTYYKPKTSEERRKYILTPPAMDELYTFSKKTGSSDPLKHTIANTTLPARPSRNPFINEESMQKNREFLKSTYPNYKEKHPDPIFEEQPSQTYINPTYSSPVESNIEPEQNNVSTTNSIEDDFVNLKLEELKNNINLNSEPIVPPSNSRASLLNSSLNSNQTNSFNSQPATFEPEHDSEDYGNIHSVEETTPIQPEATNRFSNINSNRFSESNRFAERADSYQQNRFNENNFVSNQSNNNPTPVSSPKPKRKREYIKPPIDLLNTISSNISNDDADCQTNVTILEQTLDDFRIPAKVKQVTKGPAVTRYEIQMPAGISVKKVQQHAEDIAMALSANGKIRIEAPIPGKNAVGIEVPNREVATIGLRDVIDSENFNKATSPLTFALGKDITGEAKICDLRKLTHMLVAGTTGSGKSVCMNALIVSMMYKSSPEDLRFILIDPKRVEFAVFNGMPHLMLPEVISEPEKALNALSWCIKEMERRYGIIEEARVKNLKEYNESQEVLTGEKPKLPLIVVIVDELCDLMMFNKREVEEKILKLAQKSRAAGIHLVLATQRPSVDVITGTIKGNLPSRIAFAVTSFPDSKTILDCGGAERLLGKGDMLYAPQELPEPVRLQGAFISNSEVESVVDFIKQNNETDFDEETSRNIVSKQGSKMGGGAHDTSEDYDDYFVDALRLVIENGSASGSFIQRRLGIGYNRAGRIMDQMERDKLIAPSDGSNKPRAVYITMEEFERRFNN